MKDRFKRLTIRIDDVIIDVDVSYIPRYASDKLASAIARQLKLRRISETDFWTSPNKTLEFRMVTLEE